jgi:uncharacterized membrane protein YfcA
MKSSALSLNLFVAAISFYQFARQGHFKFNVLLPFVIGSMPMAFLGAKVQLEPQIYKYILSFFLLIAVGRMLLSTKSNFDESKTPNFFIALLIGAILGFFSGLIGIGGGIILSPILLLMHWANVKETAGISAMFIFLNSISGLAGLYIGNHFAPEPHIWIWAATGLVGGLAGGYFGSKVLNSYKLKYLLAFVLLIASFKLIFF